MLLKTLNGGCGCTFVGGVAEMLLWLNNVDKVNMELVRISDMHKFLELVDKSKDVNTGN